MKNFRNLALILLTTLFAVNQPLALGFIERVLGGEKYAEGRDPDAVNYIRNQSCLKNVRGITGTNTTVSRNTTTPLTSVADCQATLDGSSDTVDLLVNTLDRSLKNQNCQADLRYKLTLGSGNTIKAQVLINGATITETTLASADNGKVSLNFPCGDLSNQPSIRIAQTAGSSSQAINWAGAYIGAAKNIGSVAQSYVVGRAYFATTSGCTWSTTAAGPADFSTQSSCPGPTVEFNQGTATIQTTDADLPQVTVNDLGPGTYRVEFDAQVSTSNSGSYPGLAISDGTTTSGQLVGISSCNSSTSCPTQHVSGVFNYTSSGNRTFKLQGMATNSATTQVSAADNGRRVNFTITFFPSSSQLAYNPSTAFPVSTADYQNASNCVWAYTTTSIGTFAADTDCSTPVLTGSATAPSTKIPGVTFTKLPAGTYQVNITGSWQASTNGCIFGIYDGTSYKNQSYMGSGSNGATKSAIFSYSSEQSNITFQAAVKAESGSTCSLNQSTGGVYGTDDNHLRVEVIPVNPYLSIPVLVGSVTSQSTGAERIERIKVSTSGGVCTTISSSGSWVSSCTSSGTGTFTLNFPAGTWSAIPTCTATCSYGSGDNCKAYVETQTAPSTTVTKFQMLNNSASGVDTTGNVICMGPR